MTDVWGAVLRTGKRQYRLPKRVRNGQGISEETSEQKKRDTRVVDIDRVLRR